ncbi:hypothetical protein B0I37DRAFT_173717 [Chaetomium sp. MPI-CAGE-AT-0009]|nr:hypothetical protein B0I37DRAFT_173717 [Chaetomium sp. MPI-CAGE-AT-0009]
MVAGHGARAGWLGVCLAGSWSVYAVCVRSLGGLRCVGVGRSVGRRRAVSDRWIATDLQRLKAVAAGAVCV